MRVGEHRVRVIVDTNILIGFLIGKRLRGLEDRLKSERFVLVVSPLLAQEFQNVVARPGFRKYFPQDEVERLIGFFKRYGKWVVAERPETPISGDPEDDLLLTLALKSKAHVLVTGDKDLLRMRAYGRTTIMSASDFMAHYL